MMVIDASVVVAALITVGPGARWAEDIVARSFSAPHHLPVEVVHVLRREQLRGRIEKSAAALVLDDLDGLDVEYFEFSPLRERVWELRPTVSPYDAWCVALAEELGVPLATFDGRLAGAPGPRCEFVTPP